MDEEPLNIARVAQDLTDPTGETFIMCFNRDMTPYERSALPILFSARVARTNVASLDTVMIGPARREHFTRPQFLNHLQRLVDEVQALRKWVTEYQFDDIIQGLEVELDRAARLSRRSPHGPPA
jgi:hypothetical protein